MAWWWTKRSLPGSSGVMKPKPFSSLNHLTVPVAMCISSCANGAEEALRQRLRTLALLWIEPFVRSGTSHRLGDFADGVVNKAFLHAFDLVFERLILIAALVELEHRVDARDVH